MTENFSELDHGLSLLSSMYHQDWRTEGDWTVVLKVFLWEDQAIPAALALYEDAQALGGLPRAEAENVWVTSTDGTFRFGRDADSADRWLSAVQEHCRGWLASRGVSVLPDQVPAVERVAAGAVVAQTGSVAELFDADDDVTDALDSLRKLAETRSPGLAFRLLLRIIDTKRVEMSSQLYRDLTLLGRDLHCGEFVVSSLEYLVVEPAHRPTEDPR